MRRSRLLLGAIIALLAVGCFLIMHGPFRARPVFSIGQIETTLTWGNGPDVKLNPQSMEKLNREVDRLIQQEAPGSTFKYPVVSLDKRFVEIMYVGDQSGAPEPLQKTLNAFIEKRAPELAREQAP